jgi:lysophospholipase L1-like esterase
MYWGKVIKDLEMQVGVINTWSGSMAYGRSDDVGNNMLVRANNLHRDNGTPNDTSDDIAPDVIIIYFGINDLNGGSPLDKNFENAIADGYSKSNLDAWFSAVKSKADSVGKIIKGETYASFEQVYALSLNVMKEKYPNAEIYCLTYQESNHQHTTRGKLDKFNKTIKALAEYFDVTVVDQSKDEITWETCHAYGGDMRALHPSAAGHEVMAENIGYKKIKWDDINQYYYPVGLSDRKRDEAILRRVQIDASLAQIKNQQEHAESAQVNPQDDFNNQMLIKALENPDGFLKLFEVAEKAQKFSKGGKIHK